MIWCLTEGLTWRVLHQQLAWVGGCCRLKRHKGQRVRKGVQSNQCISNCLSVPNTQHSRSCYYGRKYRLRLYDR